MRGPTDPFTPREGSRGIDGIHSRAGTLLEIGAQGNGVEVVMTAEVDHFQGVGGFGASSIFSQSEDRGEFHGNLLRGYDVWQLQSRLTCGAYRPIRALAHDFSFLK